VLALLAGIAGAAVAGAAETGQGHIEEVIVTAQKREQLLQDVPIAMTVLDETSLALRGFSRLDDIAFATPNLAITTPSGSRSAQFTIRGITGQTFFPAAESAVGVFLDGVYLNNASAQIFDLLDVERIEVLRGPQGTLYGKNAAAGAINVISRRPDAERRLEMLAEYGNYDRARLAAKAGGPLGDAWFGSVGVGYHTRNGFQDNPFLDAGLDDADSWSARGALRFAPGGALEVNLTADFMKEDRAPAALDATPGDRESNHNFQDFEQRDVYGTNLTIDYDLTDSVTFTSITSLRDYQVDRGTDDDGTTIDAFQSTGSQSTQQLSQELRLASSTESRFQWLAGGYYLNADMDDRTENNLFPDPLFTLLSGRTCTDLFTFQLILAGFPPDQAAAAAAASCAPGVAGTRSDHEAQTWAAFGQASYELTDALSLTAGVRASWEEKDFRLRQPGPGVALFLLPDVDASFSRDDTSVDPMASLLWRVNDAVNVYATVAKGSKSGGFNTGAVGDANQLADPEFDEETLVNYELGLKTTTFGGRVQLNLAAFSIDYENLQVFRIEPNAQGVPTARITNVAEATSRGVEVDLTATLGGGWTITSGLGYLDAEYDDYSQCGQNSAGALLDCSDNQLTNAPEWTGSVNLIYRRPFAWGTSLLVNGEWSYRGDVYYDVFNTEGAFQQGFSIFNGSVGVEGAAGNWAVTLWGTNLGDEEYITVGIQGFGGNAINTLGPPRQYGVRVTGRL
jgi:iron complex outermembrane receptor protein